MVSLHPTKNCWTLETFEEMINQKWNENARQSFLNYNNSLKATYWSAYTQQKIVELCKYLRKWLTRNEMKILDDLKITSSKKNKSYLIISDSKHILIFLSLWIMGPFARLFSFLPSCFLFSSFHLMSFLGCDWSQHWLASPYIGVGSCWATSQLTWFIF